MPGLKKAPTGPGGGPVGAGPGQPGGEGWPGVQECGRAERGGRLAAEGTAGLQPNDLPHRQMVEPGDISPFHPTHTDR